MRFFRSSLQCFFTVLLLITILGSGYAYAADDKNIENKIMSHEYAGGVLNQDEINYLKDHPELASKRAEKDVKHLMEKMDIEMNESMSINKTNKDDLSIMTTSVTLGQDVTIYNCETGNKGGDSSGIGDWASNYSASEEWCDVSTTVGGIGDASAWAWTGPKIYVSGSGSKNAYIKFNGSYNGGYFGGIGGSSTAKVRVSVWDYTRDTEIAGKVVWEGTDSSSLIRKYVDEDSFGTTGTVVCPLEAGHTYALRFGISAASTEYGPYLSDTDFWGAEGLNTSSVKVDF